jgi:hypothetical protein
MVAKRPKRSIAPPAVVADDHVRFSFEFYDTSDTRYCLSRATAEQVRRTLARLKEVNQNSVAELRQKSDVYHFHAVDWDRTAEPQGFPDSRLLALPSYQFALLGVNQQRARVYGVLHGNTFYIVWFDLDHAIWPSFKKHT